MWGSLVFRQLAVFGFFLAIFGSGQIAADVIDGEELVDPTRPVLAGNVNDSALIQELIRNVVPASYDVSFIRAGSSSPLAVINRQRVTIGDIIGGAEVKAIDRSGVTLLIGDEERRIGLYDVSVKTTSVSQ